MFQYVGTAADYLLDEYIPVWGVFNGCPYKIEADDNDGNFEVIFDGYIVLSEYQINSKAFPKILIAPVREYNNNITVFDRVSVVSQQLLLNQGFIQQSDFKYMPEVIVSKLNAKDRAIAIGSLSFQILTFFSNAVQGFLSAISDILGLSAAIGLVELATLFLELAIQIQQLIDLIFQHRDLLLASQTWFKVISLKTVIERAFEKFGYTVDFGEIEPVINNLYLKSSRNGELGAPSPLMAGLSGNGILKRQDYGYLISESMELAKTFFNTRQDIQGTVVHIKAKTDPFWTDSPAFQPEDVLIETTEQYSNGFYRNKTEDVDATVIVAYNFDPMDPWTLEAENGDSYEIHRELISELDPRSTTLKGIKDVKIPLAMGIRYDVTETLNDLLEDVFDSFGVMLDDYQFVIEQFSSFIDSAANADQGVADVLSTSPINFIFALSSGGLKVADDTYGLGKLIYANEELDNGVPSGILNMPPDYKDFISGKAIYERSYLPDSPADVNDFKGQCTEAKQVRIPFGLVPFQQTKFNPYFLLNSNNAKFTHIAWEEDGHSAETDIDINEPFDENITEIEV